MSWLRTRLHPVALQQLDFKIPKDASRRRQLLPKWLLFFCWFFMTVGTVMLIISLVSIFFQDFGLYIYGLHSEKPMSALGISLITIFGLKSVVAFGLWFEKDWAVYAGLLDAIIGLSICFLIIFGFSTEISAFRPELLLLIPFLIRLLRIHKRWNDFTIKKNYDLFNTPS